MKNAIFHSIKLPFDAEVAEKFLNGIYCALIMNRSDWLSLAVGFTVISQSRIQKYPKQLLAYLCNSIDLIFIEAYDAKTQRFLIPQYLNQN